MRVAVDGAVASAPRAAAVRPLPGFLIGLPSGHALASSAAMKQPARKSASFRPPP